LNCRPNCSACCRRGIRAAGKLAHASNRCTFDCRYEPRFGIDGKRARFRSDLFFRLNVFRPRAALRERTEIFAAGAALHAAVFPRHEQVIETIPSAQWMPCPGIIGREHTGTSECDRARANYLDGPALNIDITILIFKGDLPAKKTASPKSTNGALHSVLEKRTPKKFLRLSRNPIGCGRPERSQRHILP